MLLEEKTAVIYGGGGSIGRAVARAFAREGAKLFLAGRTIEKLEVAAAEVSALGGEVEVARVDALDEAAVEQHADEVVRKAGTIDISFNLVGITHLQGTSLRDLAVADFAVPIMNFAKTHFLTARAAARRMVKKSSGVILMMTTTPSRMAFPFVGPFGAACGAIEGLAHTLAAELGTRGIRVVCLLSSGSPESAGVAEVMNLAARSAGTTSDDYLEAYRKRTLLGRLTSLEEVANTAAFMASDRASAVTGTAINLTCGAIVD